MMTRRISLSRTSRGSLEHAYKFGGEARHVRFNQIGAVVPRGRFSWDGRYTQGGADVPNAAATTGQPLADFLLGP